MESIMRIFNIVLEFREL